MRNEMLRWGRYGRTRWAVILGCVMVLGYLSREIPLARATLQTSAQIKSNSFSARLMGSMTSPVAPSGTVISTPTRLIPPTQTPNAAQTRHSTISPTPMLTPILPSRTPLSMPPITLTAISPSATRTRVDESGSPAPTVKTQPTQRTNPTATPTPTSSVELTSTFTLTRTPTRLLHEGP